MQPSAEIDQLVGEVFGEEQHDKLLKRCHAAQRDVMGLRFYAVDGNGALVCSRRAGPRFCQLIQASPEGRSACHEHFSSAAQDDPYADGEAMSACHAGLAAWHIKFGDNGFLAACGGRVAGSSTAQYVRQLAGRLHLDPDELVAAFAQVPEHSLEDLGELAASLAANVSSMTASLQQAAEHEQKAADQRTRARHARNEIEEFTREYEEVSREAFAKSEQFLKANQRLQRQIAENKEMFIAFVRALASAIDAKDPYTHNHSQRVTQLALLLGDELGLDEGELKTLELAGLLHDIGKIGMPESVLNKPSRLTEEEFAVVKMHPVVGARILQRVRQLREPIRIFKHHHERYDGTGYPDGLSGQDIPLGARILSVADSFDAITSDRPYRKGASIEEGVAEIRRCAGTQFDPGVVDAMVRIHDGGLLPGGIDDAAAAVALFRNDRWER